MACDVLFMIHPLTGMIHPLTCMIHPLTGMIHPLTIKKTPLTIKKQQVTGKMHFFDFLIKVDLINFNLMAKERIKKNSVNEETKGPETLQ